MTAIRACVTELFDKELEGKAPKDLPYVVDYVVRLLLQECQLRLFHLNQHPFTTCDMSYVIETVARQGVFQPILLKSVSDDLITKIKAVIASSPISEGQKQQVRDEVFPRLEPIKAKESVEPVLQLYTVPEIKVIEAHCEEKFDSDLAFIEGLFGKSRAADMAFEHLKSTPNQSVKMVVKECYMRASRYSVDEIVTAAKGPLITPINKVVQFFCALKEDLKLLLEDLKACQDDDQSLPELISALSKVQWPREHFPELCMVCEGVAQSLQRCTTAEEFVRGIEELVDEVLSCQENFDGLIKPLAPLVDAYSKAVSGDTDRIGKAVRLALLDIRNSKRVCSQNRAVAELRRVFSSPLPLDLSQSCQKVEVIARSILELILPKRVTLCAALMKEKVALGSLSEKYIQHLVRLEKTIVKGIEEILEEFFHEMIVNSACAPGSIEWLEFNDFLLLFPPQAVSTLISTKLSQPGNSLSSYMAQALLTMVFELNLTPILPSGREGRMAAWEKLSLAMLSMEPLKSEFATRIFYGIGNILAKHLDRAIPLCHIPFAKCDTKEKVLINTLCNRGEELARLLLHAPADEKSRDIGACLISIYAGTASVAYRAMEELQKLLPSMTPEELQKISKRIPLSQISLADPLLAIDAGFGVYRSKNQYVLARSKSEQLDWAVPLLDQPLYLSSNALGVCLITEDDSDMLIIDPETGEKRMEVNLSDLGISGTDRFHITPEGFLFWAAQIPGQRVLRGLTLVGGQLEQRFELELEDESFEPKGNAVILGSKYVDSNGTISSLADD